MAGQCARSGPAARGNGRPCLPGILLRCECPGITYPAGAAPALPPTLEGGDVTLDPGRRVAFRAGRRLELSPKEFAVLECLLAAGGRVVSAEELLERAWDEAADPFTTAVKTTIRRLRAKLGDPPVIHTVREGGYRIGEV
jgi:DNA-binding response OmpR family regulator